MNPHEQKTPSNSSPLKKAPGAMQAASYERQGAAREVLTVGDLPVPSPGPGEVAVAVHASGVNPSDLKFRSGWNGLPMGFERVIPHQDGAGIITAVGSGVEPSRVGERVWIYEAQLGRAHGTAAEAVVVPASHAVTLPEEVSFAEGAALGVPAMTAHFAVFGDGPVEGKTILVQGGAGAVGNAAIQLAKWGGARVVATVSSEPKARLAQDAGADLVVDYRTQDVREVVSSFAAGEGIDRIVEVALAPNLATDLAVLAPNGVIAAYESGNAAALEVPFYELLMKNAAIRFVLVYAMSPRAHARAIADINAALRARALRPVLGPRFPLGQIADAHEALEQGAIGKVVVQIQ